MPNAILDALIRLAETNQRAEAERLRAGKPTLGELAARQADTFHEIQRGGGTTPVPETGEASSDDIWLDEERLTIRLGGKTKSYPARVGMRLLHHLLLNPDRSFSPLDLRADALGEQLPDEGAVRYDKTHQDKMDSRAEKEYLTDIRKLEDTIKKAEEAGNEEVALKAEKDRAAIFDHLRSSRSAFGRSRQFPDEHKRARDSASQAIRRALNTIESDFEYLAVGMRRALHLGEEIRLQTPTDPR